MNKRGQLAIFMIVGVLLVGLFLLIFFLVSTNKEVKQPQEVYSGNSIQSYVQSCIESTAKAAITHTGKQGGYYKLPLLEEYNTPYYFYDKKSTIITKEEIEKELSSYINNELFFCLQNFQVFKDQGIKITSQEVSTTTLLKPDSVMFDITFPVSFEVGGTKKEIVTFSTIVSHKYGTIFNNIKQFIKDQEQTPDSICITCIVEMGYKVSMIPIDDKIIFEIKHNDFMFSINQYEGFS